MTGSPKLPERALGGSSVVVSVLGVSIDPAPLAPPQEDRLAVAAVKQLRSDGVTILDIAEARSPSRALGVIRAALPRVDPGVVIIVGGLGSAGRVQPSETGQPGPITVSVAGPPDREAWRVTVRAARSISSVWVDQSATGASATVSPATREQLNGMVREGTIVGWSVRLPVDPPEDVDPVRARDPVSAPLSLLDRRWLGFLRARGAHHRGGVILRNPFADGRLDGSRISLGVADRSPQSRPIDVRALHAEFDPVLALAPLTRSGARTLAQAALQWAVAWPWTASVLLPLPSPSRWSELRAAFERRAPTPEEWGQAGLEVPGEAGGPSST